ncbi:MAG: hemerythrin family protein [Gammaproteobacteria bacterium]|nr:hemerythrin family protein [Gammaproteobacteria bacterium]
MLNYPRVAIDFMNNDHAEFVALRKHLLDLLHSGADHAQVDGLLDALLEHTRLHFAEEEQLMLSVQFPPYPMHKGEHDKVLADMIARAENWKTSRNSKDLSSWLEHAVRDWFVNHVSSMDFVTAAYIQARSA